MLQDGRVELRHLRYYVAVAEALHFSRAAARLHMTQPALSRQVRDLEEELGVRLLFRHGTRTLLTQAGVLFLERARCILALADDSVREVREKGREVRLGHYGTLWTDHYGPALRLFARRFPKIRLRAVEQTPVGLVESLRRGEIDIALIGPAGPALNREFAVKRLGEVSALVAMSVSHPLAKRRKVAIGELREVPWVVWDEKDFPGRLAPLRDAAARAGFAPRVVGQADSVASLFVQLCGSDAVGYVLPMSRKLPHEGICFCSLKAPGVRLPMDVIWKKGTPASSPVAALAGLLENVPPAK